MEYAIAKCHFNQQNIVFDPVGSIPLSITAEITNTIQLKKSWLWLAEKRCEGLINKVV